jgi:hypothetical protein
MRVYPAGSAPCSPKVKQQQRGFTGIFEVEAGRLFWKRGPKRGPVRRASCAVVCALQVVVVIPMAAKKLQRLHVPGGPTRLRLALQAQPNSPYEEDCCSPRDCEQDATDWSCRLAGLLRVTADDIRQRYSAPFSGIVAPQCVSNVRLVTEL